ncbi:MAG: hypothetical protein K8I27_01420 [Planctomycetes bacterium]|nr:hypothetical protein [Planctomycetota bacterium]
MPGNTPQEAEGNAKRRERPALDEGLEKHVSLQSVYSRDSKLGIVDSKQELQHLLSGLRAGAARSLVRSDISWTNFGWAPIVGCTVFDWPDGSRSYRFGRVKVHDRLDGAVHAEFPFNDAPEGSA